MISCRSILTQLTAKINPDAESYGRLEFNHVYDLLDSLSWGTGVMMGAGVFMYLPIVIKYVQLYCMYLMRHVTSCNIPHHLTCCIISNHFSLKVRYWTLCSYFLSTWWTTCVLLRVQLLGTCVEVSIVITSKPCINILSLKNRHHSSTEQKVWYQFCGGVIL